MEGPKLSNFKIGRPKLQNGKNRGTKAESARHVSLSVQSNTFKVYDQRIF